jgi:predicted metal-dependent hydrolase
LVHLKSAKLSSSVLKKLYESWLREKAQNIFEDKVEKHSKRIGVRVKQIAVKNLRNRWGNLRNRWGNLRNRWGSLTNKGVINLNVNLMKAPEDVIDYIILHELCHLNIKEHSRHYWNMAT